MESLFDFLLAVIAIIGLLVLVTCSVFLFFLLAVFSLILGILATPFVLVALWLEDK
jgi:hypothetical protein